MCPHEEQLTAWLLGDLPPEEHRAMTRHLESCAACRAVKEELARVLAPLRSGLEKDRNLHVAPLPVRERPRRALLRLWSTPHEGLKRAAILTLSLGTLFALFSAVYQSTQRAPHDASDVTHITFHPAAEAPAPSLAPVADFKSDDSAEALSASFPRTQPFSTPPAPVAMPSTPAPEPQDPAFRRLVKAEAEPEAKRKASAGAAPAAAAAYAPAPAKAVAKRERSKPDSVANPRPRVELIAKPVSLAGVLAPTNAVPTNAVPTNAVPTNAVATPLKYKP